MPLYLKYREQLRRELVQVVQAEQPIFLGELARKLGIDRQTARKLAMEATRRGSIRQKKDGGRLWFSLPRLETTTKPRRR